MMDALPPATVMLERRG